MVEQPRNDYPRPQLARNEWTNLNGKWEFEFDDDRIGAKEKWYAGDRKFSKEILVPFAFQSKLSGIGDNGFHDVVWYKKTIELAARQDERRTILHFGAVDYEATVWVNGEAVAFHEGGHTPFSADITEVVVSGLNTIVVRAQDYSKDVSLPRGKQYWLEQSASIFYTRTTGIWQTVWLETVSSIHLGKVKFTPDIDANEIQIEASINGDATGKIVRLKTEISYKGECVAADTANVQGPRLKRRIELHRFNEHGFEHWWTPENPNLYDVTFTLLSDGETLDVVHSYFGMRKISIEDGKFCLNNRPYYMKLVLDQGYFPDGNLTPPSDDAIKRDVELTKAMGFNGARKHQKVEDPRYLYWCDRLGLLVWGEAPNAHQYSTEYVRRFTKEWQEIVERDYNHPSIVVWVPLNESWGVSNVQIDKQQQHHALTMYHLTKSLDATRLAVSNDGWELLQTDLFNIHDYEWRQEVLEDRYGSIANAVSAMPANRRLAVGGYSYEGQPIIVTEFGGIAYKKSEWDGWGYSGADSDEDFLRRLNAVVSPMHASPVVQGYCYTQLTDVEQEINGLLTYDRQPKVPLEDIRKIVIGV